MAATMGLAKSRTSTTYWKPLLRSPMIWPSSTGTSSKVTVAVLESFWPSLSSGFPVRIVPPPGRRISRDPLGCSTISPRDTMSWGTMTQAIMRPFGFPTLQKTVNWLA